IDKARYGDFEGVIATNAPAPDKGNTLARSNYTDTDNDKNDFAETTVPTKGQANVISAPAVGDSSQTNSDGGGSGSGVVINNPNLQNSVGAIVINELVSDPAKGMKEFIELYNAGDSAISLVNWWIEDGGGVRTDLNGQIAAKKYLVVDGPHGSLNNDGEAISLYDSGRNLADKVVYGSWNDGNLKDNAPTAADPYSLARKADGGDHNNDAFDFAITQVITMGAGNIIQRPTASVSTSTPVSVLEKIKLIPAALFQNGQSVLEVDAERDVIVDEVVAFDAGNSLDASGRPLRILWRFGDGRSTEGVKTEHIYEESGNYFVTVEGFDQANQKIEESFYITVHDSLESDFSDDPIAVSDEADDAVATETAKSAKSANKSAKPRASDRGEVSLEQIDGLASGDKVKVRGVVSTLPGVFGSQYFYITDEDNQNGAQIYLYKKDFPVLALGDDVTVVGTISRAYNEMRVKILDKKDIFIIGKKTELAARSVAIEEISPEMRGALLRVEGEITELKSAYMYMDDGSEELKVYFKKGAGINKKEWKEGDVAEATGILGMAKAGVQLLPRSSADIKIVQAAKPLAEAEDKKAVGAVENYFAATAGGITTVVLSFFARARKTVLLAILKKIGLGLAMVFRKILG
ncbi:MAG: lamin tail domain-containing protein, partial [Patescibacteria group bacterium]